MVIPLAMLAVLAFVVIRSLMGVVAHGDAVTPVATAVAAESGIASHARANDDARGMLLPAARAADADADADAGVAVDLTAADANAS